MGKLTNGVRLVIEVAMVVRSVPSSASPREDLGAWVQEKACVGCSLFLPCWQGEFDEMVFMILEI